MHKSNAGPAFGNAFLTVFSASSLSARAFARAAVKRAASRAAAASAARRRACRPLAPACDDAAKTPNQSDRPPRCESTLDTRRHLSGGLPIADGDECTAHAAYHTCIRTAAPAASAASASAAAARAASSRAAAREAAISSARRRFASPAARRSSAKRRTSETAQTRTINETNQIPHKTNTCKWCIICQTHDTPQRTCPTANHAES